MKKHLLIIALITCVGFLNAQKKKIIGNWLVTQVEIAGEFQYPYQIANYTEDGKMIMMGMEVATWKYNKKSNEIEKKSDFDKDFNGNDKILSLTNKELIVENNGVKVTYQKLDLKKNVAENKKSGLIGTWEFKGVPYSYAKSFVTFREPNEFTIIEKQEGMESTLNGVWMFNKKDMSLIMIGLRGEDTFKGQNKIIKINGETLELINNSNVYKGNKKVESPIEEENTIAIEHLMFTYDDFFTEDGDEKYASEKEKLPWHNWREMKEDILNIDQLVYSYEYNDENNAVFKKQLLTTDVIANLEDEGFVIEDIFKGYDNSGNPEQGPNTDYNNPLYPLNDKTYRVAGNEQITTPAGTFDCTVIEVSNYYDLKKKLWMINDKIGVYAKIIDENTTEDYGYYHIYELQEITKK